MEEGQRLSNDELRQAAEAVIACGVERDVLVAALGRTTRSLLESRTTPGGQILEDLFALRDLGESHLREWIEQAFVLTKPRRESALFERLRKKLDDPIAEEPKRRREWGRVWVGREEEMAELEEAFAAPPGAQRPVAIVALQGMGGIGKTYLAERFAWQHADKFPGGRLQIPLEIERRPTLDDDTTPATAPKPSGCCDWPSSTPKLCGSPRPRPSAASFATTASHSDVSPEQPRIV